MSARVDSREISGNSRKCHFPKIPGVWEILFEIIGNFYVMKFRIFADFFLEFPFGLESNLLLKR